ncbi:MAG: hypothetical protein Q7R96_03500 [Nanoarchaeota archaeon]|nr:hypothetical protein [Nanoarchaeota archaeon]
MTTEAVQDERFKTLADLGKVIDSERKNAGDAQKPLYEDEALRRFDTGEELVLRTFQSLGHDNGRRGLYLLKTREGVVRLGSVAMPDSERVTRRGIYCGVLNGLARKLDILPLSRDQATDSARKYLNSKYSQ